MISYWFDFIGTKFEKKSSLTNDWIYFYTLIEDRRKRSAYQNVDLSFVIFFPRSIL
jgi:hypothetical protein